MILKEARYILPPKERIVLLYIDKAAFKKYYLNSVNTRKSKKR
jgi:hypothetical protein